MKALWTNHEKEILERLRSIEQTQDVILELLRHKDAEDKLRDYRDPISGLFKRK